MNEQIIKRLRDAGDRLPLIGDTGTNLHLDAAKEIEKLQAEVKRLRAYTSDTGQWTRKLEQTVLEISEERDQLTAQVNAITSAISTTGVYKTSEELCDLMHSTPVQCLAQHDAEVIERALDHLERKATADGFFTIDPFWLKEYAAQIRQRAKESPNEA